MGFYEALSPGSLQTVYQSSKLRGHNSRYKVCIILNAALSLMKHIVLYLAGRWVGTVKVVLPAKVAISLSTFGRATTHGHASHILNHQCILDEMECEKRLY